MGQLSRRAAISLGAAAGFAGPTRADDGPAPAALGVGIAVPIFAKGDRWIVLGKGRSFPVVLTNRSDRPLRLWSFCSDSEFNLSFEVVEEGKARTIGRQGQGWDKNICSPLELLPGDHLVETVTFLPDAWAWPWAESERQPRLVRMRATYRNEPSRATAEQGVWTGRAESPFASYRFEGDRLR